MLTSSSNIKAVLPSISPIMLVATALSLLSSLLLSMVFVGTINQSVETILKTSHLFEPFPSVMANDSAFFDRMHCYVPGWEIPKYRPEYFTNDYGFITDYFAEVLRELRKVSFADAIDKYFKLGNNLNQRDVIAVKKTVSGLAKLLYYLSQ